MNAQWAAEFAAKARAYWTDERTRSLIGDKQLLILPGEAPLLLRALGLLHRDASMPPSLVRKYRQINHMVIVLLPSLRALRERFESVRILDAACGRSYLSTLLAWHFRNNWKHPVQILGVDHSPNLVDVSRRRAEQIGLQDVIRFDVASLQQLEVRDAWRRAWGQADPQAPFHGLISLHGCDTATDAALGLALQHQAHMLAVVPCCQAELSSRWAELDAQDWPGAFAPVWAQGHLRRTTAANVTDMLRLLLVRSQGYEASALEFVPSEHTPKNTLIRGLRRQLPDPQADLAATAQYHALKDSTGGVGIHLETLVTG